MGFITKIEALPRMKRRLVVYVDGEKLGVIAAGLAREKGLSEGGTLSDQDWQQYMEEEISPAFDLSLYYLGLKARTRHEMEAYLKRRQYAPQVIAAVMDKLKEYGFVDDEQLSQRAVDSLSRQRLGRGAIERKLRQRGVDKELAREALDAYRPEDESENARQLAATLWERYREAEPRKRWQKTTAALARRGFSWESIQSAMQGLSSGDASDPW
jgi:regulatory protein